MHKLNRSAFVAEVRALLSCKAPDYKAACNAACALQFYEDFAKEDFVVPLVVEDRAEATEEFLTHRKDMQVKGARDST